MSLYILKFGGSSLSTVSRIRHVAKIVLDFKQSNHDVVIVTSAMHGITNQLIEYVNNFSSAQNREYDFIVSSGELISAGLLALALQAEDIKAQALSSWQIPILASGNYGNARITDVRADKLFNLITSGIVPVITGFQGLSDNNEILTLGRGGSDATACALASFLKADECLIYTDVIGVFTADPKIVPAAILIKEISFNDMLLLSKYGAKVMQYQSILIAKQYNITIRVLSSFSKMNQYTLIKDSGKNTNGIIGLTYYDISINDTIITMIGDVKGNSNNFIEILMKNNIRSKIAFNTNNVIALEINKEQLAAALNILHKVIFGK